MKVYQRIRVGEDNIERWRACKVGMIFEEAKFRAKGAKAFTIRTYFSTHPRVKLHLSRCCTWVNEKKNLKGAWDLGPNVKLQHVLAFEENVLPKVLFNLSTKIAKVGLEFFGVWLCHFEYGRQDIIERK